MRNRIWKRVAAVGMAVGMLFNGIPAQTFADEMVVGEDLFIVSDETEPIPGSGIAETEDASVIFADEEEFLIEEIESEEGTGSDAADADAVGEEIFSEETELVLAAQEAAVGDEVTSGDYVYTVGTDGISIKSYSGTDTVLTLPAEIDGYAVTGILEKAFQNREFTQVILPDSLRTIGNYAFQNCAVLETADLGDGVISIGNYAFSGARNLAAIELPDSLQTIGNYAFQNCSAMQTADLGGVVTIGEYAFRGCSALESITIPDSTTTIGRNAFQNCSAMTQAVLGSSLTSLGSSAFGSCSTLTELTVKGNAANYSSGAFSGTAVTSLTIGEDASNVVGMISNNSYFTRLQNITVEEGNAGYSSADGVLLSADGTRLIQYPAGKTDTQYAMPDTVIAIEPYAFSGANKLTAIDLPDSLQTIGNYAFQNCSAMQAADLGGAVTIGEYAFRGCSALEEITIPDSTTTIGRYAFQSCSALTQAVLGSSLASLGSSVFNGCSRLSSLTVRGDAANYNSGAFSGTAVTSLTLGAGAANIAAMISNNNFNKLQNITVEEGSSNYSSSGGVLFNADGTSLFQYPVGKTDTQYAMPDTVTTIGNYAFQGQTALESITFSPNLTAIGQYAFSGANKLTSIDLPDSLQVIGNYAFQNCSAMQTADLGGVVTIGENAFRGCSSLEEIMIPDSATTIGRYAFQSCSALTQAVLGSSLASLGSSAFNSCSRLSSLTVRGDAANYNSGAFSGTAVTSLTLGAGAANIAAMISNNNFNKLQNITVEEGSSNYSSSGGVLFNADGTSLFQYPVGKTDTQYAMPDTVTTIGNYAFQGQTALESITFSPNLTAIGQYAFSGANKLTSIDLPDSLQAIGNNAFQNCSALQTANLGGVVTIGENAFRNCSSLEAVTIPDSTTTVGRYAFQSCSAMTQAVLGSSLTSLGSSAFNSCSRLSSLTVRGDAANYNSGAFSGTAVTSLTLGAEAANITALISSNNSYFNKLQSITAEAGSVSYSSTDGVLFNADGTRLIQYPAGKTDTQYAMPDTVLTIRGNAFQGNTAIEDITFSQNLTAIEDYAFSGANKLTAIDLPDSLQTIGSYAFQNCSAMQAAELGGVVTIGDYAFRGCSALEEITIPDSTTAVRKYAFQNCTAMTQAVLGSGVTTLDNYAFGNCSSLTVLTINGTISSFSSSAFSGVTLSELTIGKDVTNLESILNYLGSVPTITIDGESENYSYSDGIVYNADQTTLLKYPTSLAAETFTVPATVTGIGQYAFRDNTHLISITLPDGLQSIGQYAFSGCSALAQIRLPGTLTSIGSYVFNRCTALESVSVGDGAGGFGSSCFYGCSALQELTVEGGSAGFNTGTFNGATLTKLRIGKNVSSISDQFITITTLTDIEVEEGNAAYSSADGVLYSADGATLIRYPRAKADESYTVQAGVSVIAREGFSHNQILISVTLPSGLTQIGESAFNDCSKLQSIEIPDQTEKISQYAFRYCSALTSITLGAGLTQISSYAFGNCGTVDSVSFNGVSDVIDANAFNSTSVKKVILGASAAVFPDVFLKSTTIESIEVDEANEKYAVSDSALMSKDLTTLYKYFGSGSSLTLPDTVTAVGSYAFYKKSSLTSLELPSTLTEIGDYAFYQCTGITGTVSFDQMHSIGAYAFSGCTGITGLEVTTLETTDPETGEVQGASIGDYAFQSCSELAEMDFDGDAPSISSNTFNNVSGVVKYDGTTGNWSSFMDRIFNSAIVMLEKGPCERAIVLVVDVSGSMSGGAIQALREAVSQFCETVISDDGKTKVVIVSYASSFRTFGFTSDLELLKARASTLSANGGTNMSSALSMADRCLRAISAQEKDLIMMTDGLPNEGSTSSTGPFTSSDHSCYNYANAVCGMCEGYWDDYRVFSLGFFHSLSGTEKDFASRFMDHIDNSGYFEVTDIDRLLEIFADMAQELLSPLEISVSHTTAIGVILNDPSEEPYVEITVNADITNRNRAAAGGVKAKIDLDSDEVADYALGLTLLSAEEVLIGDIQAGETKHASWKLKAPMLLDTHDYRCGIVAGADNAVAVKAVHTMTIDPEATSDRTFTAPDKWNFGHYGFGSYAIRDDLYQYLLKCANGGKDYSETSANSAATALAEYYNTHVAGTWGGSCFGMTTTAILLKLGQLTSQFWDNEKIVEDTSGLELSEMKDVINYYHLLQQSSANVSILRNRDTDETEIDFLIRRLASNQYGFAKVGISYDGVYNQRRVDNAGTDHEEVHEVGSAYSNGHAIVAYGSPMECSFSCDGVSYDRYIPVYDINTYGNPDRVPYSYIYYQNANRSVYMVPRYGTHEYGKSYIDYSSLRITSISDDWSAYRGYNPEKKDYVSDQVLNANAHLTAVVHTLEISDAMDNHTSIKGLDAEGNLNVWVYYDEMEVDGDSSTNSRLNVILDDPDRQYAVSSRDGKPFKMMMQYDDALGISETSADSVVTFDGNRGMGMDGNSGQYRMTFVFDELFDNTDLGNKITVRGSEQEDLTIQRQDDGYELISSQPLQNVSIVIEGGRDTRQIDLKTDSDKVLITNDEQENKVKIDTDQDGTYDTVLTDPGADPGDPEPPAEQITISKKPTIKKPSAAKNKITVTWKHFKHTSKKTKPIWKKIRKVQIQCATDSSFTNIVKDPMVGRNKTKAVIKGLQRKTTYYVRVRYFDGAGYSDWSKAKKIRTK